LTAEMSAPMKEISVDSSMQRVMWAKSGAERPRFKFAGKPDTNVTLEYHSDPLVYLELFCAP
jgi:hypothetical protein